MCPAAPADETASVSPTPSPAARSGARPPLGLVLAVAVAILGVPWLSPAGVGSWSMFAAPVEYRLDVAAWDAGPVPRRVPLRSLRPHLGFDARRVITPADEYVVGETNAALLAGGLDDLASLVCALSADTRQVRVVLRRRHLDHTAPTVRDETHACPR